MKQQGLQSAWVVMLKLSLLWDRVGQLLLRFKVHLLHGPDAQLRLKGSMYSYKDSYMIAPLTRYYLTYTSPDPNTTQEGLFSWEKANLVYSHSGYPPKSNGIKTWHTHLTIQKQDGYLGIKEISFRWGSLGIFSKTHKTWMGTFGEEIVLFYWGGDTPESDPGWPCEGQHLTCS